MDRGKAHGALVLVTNVSQMAKDFKTRQTRSITDSSDKVRSWRHLPSLRRAPRGIRDGAGGEVQEDRVILYVHGMFTDRCDAAAHTQCSFWQAGRSSFHLSIYIDTRSNDTHARQAPGRLSPTTVCHHSTRSLADCWTVLRPISTLSTLLQASTRSYPPTSFLWVTRLAEACRFRCWF